MGLIYDLVARAAGRRLGEPVARAVPSTPGRALLAALVLAGWLGAAGLLLSGLVWLVSGAGATAAIPTAAGIVLVLLLVRAGRQRP